MNFQRNNKVGVSLIEEINSATFNIKYSPLPGYLFLRLISQNERNIFGCVRSGMKNRKGRFLRILGVVGSLDI